MIPDDDAIQPRLTVLSDQQRQRMHEAIVEVLEQVGMKIQHVEAQAMLRKAGCPVAEDGTARIPRRLLEAAIASAPANIDVFSRAGELAMQLGGRRSYFGTGSDVLFTLEPGTTSRHSSTLDDVRRVARLVDALPNLDFVMTLGTPSDVPPHRSYLLSVQALMEGCSKPIVCTADKIGDLSAMWDMACLIRGSEEALRQRPYLIHYAEPVSPLKHNESSVDKLLFCADKGFPVVYSPAPISGSTAPITVAGHVVQGMAECLCGLVLHQLRAEGAPFLMGMGPAVLDMATVECSYNAPEYYLSYLTEIEMSHHYDLPSWGYAGTTDTQIPDGQALMEAGMQSFLAVMAGANLCHDVGYMDFGRMGSLEMVVANNEIIDQWRRMARGVPVNDESLAVQVIGEAGPTGNFLGHRHTRANVRKVQWRPKLFSRLGWAKWKEAGGADLRARVLQRLEQLLATHTPAALDDELLAAIRSRADQFE